MRNCKLNNVEGFNGIEIQLKLHLNRDNYNSKVQLVIHKLREQHRVYLKINYSTWALAGMASYLSLPLPQVYEKKSKLKKY
jgi:hypothetical protein